MTKESRVVRDFFSAGRKFELILEHVGDSSVFLWVENGRLVLNQHSLFRAYNPNLEEIVNELQRLGKSLMTRVELRDLLGLKDDTLCRYLRLVRPDLIIGDSTTKNLPMPMRCVYEVVADFMPVLENWETSITLAKKFERARFTISQYCEDGRIEGRLFMGKVRVSPIGISQLRRILRNKEGSFFFAGEFYYHSADIAAETIKTIYGGSSDEKLYERLVARYSDWMRRYKKEFSVQEFGRRDCVKKSIRDMFCDAILPSEAARELGITVQVLRKFIRRSWVMSYFMGKTRWISHKSCLEYKAAKNAAAR